MAKKIYPFFGNIQFPTLKMIETYFQGITLNGDISILRGHSFSSICPSYSPVLINANTMNVYNKSDIWGIDIPVLINNDNDKAQKVVVIIGQDPLRNIKEFGINNCIVGTPYALHMGQNYSKGAFGRKLVNQIISSTQYSVYCTDLLKFYSANNIGNKQFSNLNSFISDTNLMNDAIKLLQNELGQINEVFGIHQIIVFGDGLKQKLNEIISKYNVKYYPHFACRPKTGWYIYPGVASGKHDVIINHVLKQI